MAWRTTSHASRRTTKSTTPTSWIIFGRSQQGNALLLDLLLLFRLQQQDNNKSNRQVVVARINLFRAVLMLLGATKWSQNIIRSNRCITNGMGSETALTSLSLVALQPSRPVTSQNGATTSRLQKKHFSRSQMVIGAILATVENTNETLDTVIDSFKTPYKVDAKLSMATMGTII
jgi:hypothetical protein